jgi:hypothetical protein
MKINELLTDFSIWTTREEDHLLEQLVTPIKLSDLNEHDQFWVQSLIRKSLVQKIGMVDPIVVTNGYS